jgi:hypothetical protein
MCQSSFSDATAIALTVGFVSSRSALAVDRCMFV